MDNGFELAIGDASKALDAAMIAAAEKAGISVVHSETEMRPGQDDCQRFAGPMDVDGTCCPFVIYGGSLSSDPRFMPMVAATFSRDIAMWVEGLAAKGIKAVKYARPPAVLTCNGGPPYTKAIWMLYAAVA